MSSNTLLDPEKRYTVAEWGNRIAFYYDRDERQPDEDTIWTGIEEPTGNVVMVMVGDDREWIVDPDDCTELDDLDYCACCGQVGCEADGRVRA